MLFQNLDIILGYINVYGFSDIILAAHYFLRDTKHIHIFKSCYTGSRIILLKTIQNHASGR